MTKISLRIISLALSLLLVPAIAAAFSSGPPNGRTNAPGEGVCTACHSSFPLNSGSGTLSITNLPDTYDPDVQYELTVQLSDPDAGRWGFEATVLDGTDTAAGTPTSLDAETQNRSSSGRTYIKHTSTGTSMGQTGAKTWSFGWTAPPAGTGDVTFYIASNAANGNFSSSGDRIYAVALNPSEDTGTAVPWAAPLAMLHQNTPNPFNPRTEISFELGGDTNVRLKIYSLDGRLVTELLSGVVPKGEHSVIWDGMSAMGRPVAGGVYLARLQTPLGNQVRRMTLVR